MNKVNYKNDEKKIKIAASCLKKSFFLYLKNVSVTQIMLCTRSVNPG